VVILNISQEEDFTTAELVRGKYMDIILKASYGA